MRWLGVWPQADGNISGMLQGDFGVSLWNQESVLDQLTQRVPVSLELGGMSLIIAWMIALPIGVFSAIRQDTWGLPPKTRDVALVDYTWYREIERLVTEPPYIPEDG